MSHRCNEVWQECDRSYCQREQRCADLAASEPAPKPTNPPADREQRPAALSEAVRDETPRPWRVSPDGTSIHPDYRDAKGNSTPENWGRNGFAKVIVKGKNPDDLRLIVKAVNSYRADRERAITGEPVALTDEQIDTILDYQHRSATRLGITNGGMVGETWNRIAARAIEAHVRQACRDAAPTGEPEQSK